MLSLTCGSNGPNVEMSLSEVMGRGCLSFQNVIIVCRKKLYVYFELQLCVSVITAPNLLYAETNFSASKRVGKSR